MELEQDLSSMAGSLSERGAALRHRKEARGQQRLEGVQASPRAARSPQELRGEGGAPSRGSTGAPRS